MIDFMFLIFFISLNNYKIRYQFDGCVRGYEGGKITVQREHISLLNVYFINVERSKT